MNFSKSGELDVVTRITGPHHHYLALQLQTEVDPLFVDVEFCSADGLIGPAEPSRADEVRSEVLKGIDAANERLATRYRASRIRFGASDPLLKDAYRAMAQRLVEHVCHLRGKIAEGRETENILNPMEVSS
jgi:hypothetical protein